MTEADEDPELEEWGVLAGMIIPNPAELRSFSKETTRPFPGAMATCGFGFIDSSAV